MELVRALLLEMEEYPPISGFFDLAINSYSEDEVSYHIKLLYEQGLIDALDLSSSSGFCWKPRNLTWEGHNFIEAIRDDSRWEKVKSFLREGGKILTIETLKEAIQKLFMERDI